MLLIVEPKKYKVTGFWVKLHNLYSSPSMKGEGKCEMWEGMTRAYKTSVVKAEGKRQLERHNGISEDNIARSSEKKQSPTFI
jgi:hypothetical protein